MMRRRGTQHRVRLAETAVSLFEPLQKRGTAPGLMAI
jgi:hypothetical protein